MGLSLITMPAKLRILGPGEYQFRPENERILVHLTVPSVPFSPPSRSNWIIGCTISIPECRATFGLRRRDFFSTCREVAQIVTIASGNDAMAVSTSRSLAPSDLLILLRKHKQYTNPREQQCLFRREFRVFSGLSLLKTPVHLKFLRYCPVKLFGGVLTLSLP